MRSGRRLRARNPGSWWCAVEERLSAREQLSVRSVRAALAASDVSVTVMLPGSVYAARTPCHDRLVQITESEMQRGNRQVTVRCPGCSGMWRASVHAPTVH